MNLKDKYKTDFDSLINRGVDLQCGLINELKDLYEEAFGKLNDEERKIKAEQLTDVVFKELEGLTTADAIPCLSYCILTLLNYVSQCSLVPIRELVLQFSKTLYEMQGTFLPRKPKMKVVNLKKRS